MKSNNEVKLTQTMDELRFKYGIEISIYVV